MKRLCIFAFYNKNGIVKPYVKYWLKELKSCSSRVIFVANGYLSEEDRISVSEYTSDVYVRPDLGLDAGAYKEVICNYLKNDLSGYDEVIFCNDSCWGPFIPLKNIFEEMAQRENSDFWGMCYTENNFANHIPGMFMVFRKRIVKNRLLQEYFFACIDEATEFKTLVIASYEIGLFDFLVRKHNMRFQYFSAIKSLDVYFDAELCIRACNFPMLKRRIGEKRYFDREKTISLLEFIKENYQYDINIILRDLSDEFGVNISEAELLSARHTFNDNITGVFVSPHTYEQIKKFTEKKPFYLMGPGFYGVIAWWIYARENQNFLGFIVSDNHPLPKEAFFKGKVYHISEVELSGKNILVTLNKKNSLDIAHYFKEMGNVMYLSALM